MMFRRLTVALASALALLAASGVARANHPLPLLNLRQNNTDGSALCTGCIANGTSVQIYGESDAATCATENYYMEVEVRSTGVAFSGVPNYSSTMVKSTCAQTAYPLVVLGPLAAGSYKWQVRERSTTGGSGTWTAFNGGGTAFIIGGGTLSASPGTLAFGSQRVGTTGATQAVTLTAAGGQVTINSISASGSFVYSGIALPVTLASGQSATVNVAFSPMTTGALTGTLVVNSTATNTPTTVSLSGTGVASRLTISPAGPVNFGNQRVGTTSAPVAFTVTNTGTVDLNVTSPMLSGPFTSAGLGNMMIGPGGSTQFTIAFAPTALGSASGVLTLPSDDPASPKIVNLLGNGVAPRINTSPASIDFGGVALGATSAPATVTVTNTGTTTLNITGGSVTGPFGFAGLSGLSVPAGGSSTFTVTFSPTAPGSVTGSVNINSDDPSSPTAYPLLGKGLAPRIAATPAAVSFGARNIGSSTPIVVSLSNPGDSKLTITGMSVGGADAGDFKLSNLPAFPATLQPAGTLAFFVEFKPTDHGARSATVSIASDAWQQSTLPIPVTGSGQGPRIALPSSTLNLGTSNVGFTSAPKVFAVNNTGETPLTISAVTLSGTDAADFAIKTALPITVNPGSSAQVSVVFTPSAVGARSAKATVASDDPLQPGVDVALTGTGTAAMVSVSPLMLDFGEVRAGVVSAAQTVTIQNTGTGALTVSAADLSGTDAMRFAVAMVSLPLQVQAGQQATLSLTFAPKSAGAHSAKLTILSDDKSSPAVVVPLIGKGTAPQLAFNPMIVDFGAQLVGRPATARTVELSNGGSAPLKITDIALGGAQAAQFSMPGAPTLPLTLDVGMKQTVSLGFTAAMVGVHDATLAITSDDPASPKSTIKLGGTGSASAIGVTPLEIEFGTWHAPAKSDGKKVTITNLSGDPITLVEASFEGAGKADYAVTPIAGALAAGKSIEATVTFQTQAATDSSASLVIAASDMTVPAAKVKLHGKALAKFVTVDPMMLAFGSVALGVASPPQTVRVTNQTDGPIEVMGVTSPDAQFVIDTAGLGGPIAAGASATFAVTFKPAKAGASTAQIELTLKGATTAEVMIAASGSGLSGGTNTGGCSVGASAAAPALPLALCALALLGGALFLRRRARRA